jgi:4-amino-4-deoxy-L-arabinose transferase-like glycosyltransferase
MRKILLLVIILLAIFFRFWQIGTNPAGFFTDEASNGINAYKIATTGRDDHGKAFPVIFEANGDWRDPVYIYSLVPSVAIFGLNEFSVRIVSAIYGIGAVILIYFLGKEVGGEKAGLLSSLLLAITPWHVHFSRVGFQLIAAVFWMLFALLFLYKSIKNKNYYALAAVGIILSFFSYSTTKLYIFPLFFLFIISHFNESVQLLKSRNFWVVNVISVVIVFSLIFPHIQDGRFFSRWNQVSHQTENSKVVQSYLNHFSYDFLFSKGDAGFFGQDVKRHSIIGMGELHYFQLPFFIIGILSVIFIKKLWWKYNFFLFFLLLYPLGSVFTQLEPQATRSVLGVIPFTVFTAVGIIEVFNILKYKHSRFIFQGLFAAVIIISIYILFIYIKAAPQLSADYWGWQYGYRPIMNYFTGKKDQYDDLLITHRFNAGADLLSFYKVEFDCNTCSIMNNPIQINSNRRQLFAIRNDDILEAHKNYPNLLFKTQNQIILPNGMTELFIGEFVKF